MALRNFHRIEIRTDHLLVHSWLDHHILDRRHTMNHLVNWLECIDATKKWTKIEEIIIFIREKNRQKQNKLRQFCSKNLRIGLLQRNWLDHRILVPASKWNFVHLGYSYGRIDSVVDKSKFGVSCYFQIICIFAKFIAASNANLINWIMRRRNIFKAKRLALTIDCDPDRECICALDGPVPIVPVWPGVAVPFWCGNVWKFIAFVGSISSRKPSKWNVAYGQISSSMPWMVSERVSEWARKQLEKQIS